MGRSPWALFAPAAAPVATVQASKRCCRDIKSENVFIDAGRRQGGVGTPRVLLGDFGISRKLDTMNQIAKTQTGTPIYMVRTPSAICAAGCIYGW